jgi:hypothetical protein
MVRRCCQFVRYPGGQIKAAGAGEDRQNGCFEQTIVNLRRESHFLVSRDASESSVGDVKIAQILRSEIELT